MSLEKRQNAIRMATYWAAQPRLHLVDLILFRRLCGRQPKRNDNQTQFA